MPNFHFNCRQRNRRVSVQSYNRSGPSTVYSNNRLIMSLKLGKSHDVRPPTQKVEYKLHLLSAIKSEDECISRVSNMDGKNKHETLQSTSFHQLFASNPVLILFLFSVRMKLLIKNARMGRKRTRPSLRNKRNS